MKTLLLFLLLCNLSYGQVLYDWTANTNPGWTSSNATNNTLSWQNSITTVSTSGFNAGTGNWYTYNNSQITNYTSPVYNFTGCSLSSFIQLTMQIDVNLENRFDWLYFQYSTNGGTTWTNPVAMSASTNGSNVNLSGYAPQTAWVNNNSNRNGWTGGLGLINLNYTIPNTANRFRFIFASDGTVNSYNIGINTYIYYADILDFTVNCVSFLPVTVLSFEGEKYDTHNLLTWDVEDEVDSEYYKVRTSTDGYTWSLVDSIKSKNLPKYQIAHPNPPNGYNYYRLEQIDLDGTTHIHDDLVAIDNRVSEEDIVSITNLLGQKIDDNYHGLILVTYRNGKIEKVYR